MFESRQLLEKRGHQFSRPLRLDVRVIEPPEVGQTMREGESGLHSRQGRVDRNGPDDLLGEGVRTGGEGPMQPVRFPAKTPEIRIRFGVLIAQIRVCGLDLLGHDVGEIGRLPCILLCSGECLRYFVRHASHREPTHCPGADEEKNQEREPDRQHLTNGLEPIKASHLASATVSSPF